MNQPSQPPPSEQKVNPAHGGMLCHRPQSTEKRLIIPFKAMNCCSAGPGFYGDDRLLPAILKEKGVLDSEWENYIKRFEGVQAAQTTGCGMFVHWVLCISGFFCCLWWSQGRYNGLLNDWLTDLNQRVLLPKGLYAKFQSSEVHIDNYHEIINWLAIALNKEEIEKLKNEAVCWGPKCCDKQTIEPLPCQNVICWCGPKRFV